MTRLKAERLRRGWSQQTLGFYAKISIADISRIERGWMKPYPAHATRLAAVLDVQPTALLDNVEASTDDHHLVHSL